VDIDPVPDLTAAEIKWLQQLLLETRNVMLGTVNDDGTAHLTPLTNGFAFTSVRRFKPKLRFYWSSFPDTKHSANIRRASQAEVAVCNSASDKPSLRFKITARELKLSEVPKALAILNLIRQRFPQLAQRKLKEFKEPKSRRLYVAEITEVYVPVPQLRDGEHIGDTHILLPQEVLRGFDA
jgi:hypothetical protein